MDSSDDELELLLHNRHQELTQQHHQTIRAAAAAASASHQLQVTILSIEKKRHRGRVAGTRNINRGTSSWFKDYLGRSSVYSAHQFRRRFRVPRVLFYKLRDDLLRFNNPFWKTRLNAAKKEGIPTDIKVLACLRYLGTGRTFDDLDDNSCMSGETLRHYVYVFCQDIVSIYGESYLNRRPNSGELQSIADKYVATGFPGCAGAIDCYHLTWKNCPLQEKGQYHNPKEGKLAVIKVQAWCDSTLYIWHWFPGRAGTAIDKTMITFSPLFQDILNGVYKFKFNTPYRLTADGEERDVPYFLADGMYPPWPLFVLPIHSTDDRREIAYTKKQEETRKDIERSFGVLQARFNILRNKDCRWYKGSIIDSSFACVIIHNLLIRMNEAGAFRREIEDEGDDIDLVSEMYDEELEMAAVRAEQRREQDSIVRNELEGTAEENWEQVTVREPYFKSYQAHKSMKDELIEKFADMGE